MTRSVILHKYSRLINCSSKIRYNVFPQYHFGFSCVNFTVYPDKGSCNSYINHSEQHHIFSSKFNAAFNCSTLRQISFLRTESNEPFPVTTEQVKLWLITEMKTIPLFFSPYDVISGKFQSALLILFRNLILRKSYSTVQIYFIKSSVNSVSWYFNAKFSIDPFIDGGCCHKLILFSFITNPSVFPFSRFPRSARWFLDFT